MRLIFLIIIACTIEIYGDLESNVELIFPAGNTYTEQVESKFYIEHHKNKYGKISRIEKYSFNEHYVYKKFYDKNLIYSGNSSYPYFSVAQTYSLNNNFQDKSFRTVLENYNKSGNLETSLSIQRNLENNSLESVFINHKYNKYIKDILLNKKEISSVKKRVFRKILTKNKNYFKDYKKRSKKILSPEETNEYINKYFKSYYMRGFKWNIEKY